MKPLLTLSLLLVIATVVPGAPAPARPKEPTVDGSRAAGTIQSLLGVNRGPLAYARRPGEPTIDLVESYRRLGIDFIRTHDFYGPMDWQVMFPRWTARAGCASPRSGRNWATISGCNARLRPGPSR